MTTRRRAGRVLVVALPLLAGVAIVVVALVSALGSPDRAEVHRFVVPAGSAARIDAGEQLELFPRRLELRAGDELRIRNDDSVDHEVGPFLVRAGETFEITFSEAGRFQGVCTLHPSGEAEIVVRDA